MSLDVDSGTVASCTPNAVLPTRELLLEVLLEVAVGTGVLLEVLREVVFGTGVLLERLKEIEDVATRGAAKHVWVHFGTPVLRSIWQLDHLHFFDEQ